MSELRNAFARVARTIPTYRNTDVTAPMPALTNEPLAQLEKAIAGQNGKAFRTAYERLTNACHLSQQHAMVVIKVPDAAMYPDQDFRTRPSPFS